MQDAQVDVGNGPGELGPDGGRHRPIAVMYLAARCALGVMDNFATFSAGNTTFPITSDVTTSQIAPVFEDLTS